MPQKSSKSSLNKTGLLAAAAGKAKAAIQRRSDMGLADTKSSHGRKSSSRRSLPGKEHDLHQTNIVAGDSYSMAKTLSKESSKSEAARSVKKKRSDKSSVNQSQLINRATASVTKILNTKKKSSKTAKGTRSASTMATTLQKYNQIAPPSANSSKNKLNTNTELKSLYIFKKNNNVTGKGIIDEVVNISKQRQLSSSAATKDQKPISTDFVKETAPNSKIKYSTFYKMSIAALKKSTDSNKFNNSFTNKFAMPTNTNTNNLKDLELKMANQKRNQRSLTQIAPGKDNAVPYRSSARDYEPKTQSKQELKSIHNSINNAHFPAKIKVQPIAMPQCCSSHGKVTCYSLKRKHAYMNLSDSISLDLPENSQEDGRAKQNNNDQPAAVPLLVNQTEPLSSAAAKATVEASLASTSSKTGPSAMPAKASSCTSKMLYLENSKIENPEYREILENVNKLCSKTSATQEILSLVMEQNRSLALEVEHLRFKLLRSTSKTAQASKPDNPPKDNISNHSVKQEHRQPETPSKDQAEASDKSSIVETKALDINALPPVEILENLDKFQSNGNNFNRKTEDMKDLLNPELSLTNLNLDAMLNGAQLYRSLGNLEEICDTSECDDEEENMTDALGSEERQHIKMLSEQILNQFQLSGLDHPRDPNKLSLTDLMSPKNYAEDPDSESMELEKKIKSIFKMNAETFQELQKTKLHNVAHNFCVKVLISNILKHLMAKMLLKKFIKTHAQSLKDRSANLVEN